MLCLAETSVTPLQEDGKLEVTPEGCFLTSTCASWHDSSYIHMNTHKQTHAHIQKEIKTESFFFTFNYYKHKTACLGRLGRKITLTS